MKAWIAAGLLAAGPAAAQDAHPCDDAVTQFDLNECTYEAWQRADAGLNDAYAAAVAAARSHDGGAGEPAESTLRAAQRAWIVFRDAACEAEAAMWHGGTGEPMIRNGCREAQTLRRTEELWDYATQFGG